MNQHQETYTEQRTYGKYDAAHIIGYLNEEVVHDFMPEGREQPGTGYRYTGTEIDGGTVMPCQDPTDYGQLTNAIIRADLTESEELATLRHHQNDPEAYAQEWEQYNQICEAAKQTARRWLGMEEDE